MLTILIFPQLSLTHLLLVTQLINSQLISFNFNPPTYFIKLTIPTFYIFFSPKNYKLIIVFFKETNYI